MSTENSSSRLAIRRPPPTKPAAASATPVMSAPIAPSRNIFVAETVGPKKPPRLASIDALRGLDMLVIVGLSCAVIAFIKALGGSAESSFWAQQMTHASWSGFHVYDLVFPLFLFLAGVSFPFSLASARARGVPLRATVGKIFFRALALVALGMVYNGFCTDVFAGSVRYASVLGRIGLAWALAALVYLAGGLSVRLSIFLIVVVGYGVLLHYVGAPDADQFTVGAAAEGLDPYFVSGHYSLAGSLNSWIDRNFLPGQLLFKGGIYTSEAAKAARAAGGMLDTEGLLATVGAVSTAILGTFAGDILLREKLSDQMRLVGLLLVAGGLGAAAYGASFIIPCIKNLWTVTFALAAGACSFMLLAIFYLLVDMCKWNAWVYPLKVVGMNSILVYLLQVIVPMESVTAFFVGRGETGLVGCCGVWGEFVFWSAYMLINILLLAFLHRHKIYIKV